MSSRKSEANSSLKFTYKLHQISFTYPGHRRPGLLKRRRSEKIYNSRKIVCNETFERLNYRKHEQQSLQELCIEKSYQV